MVSDVVNGSQDSALKVQKIDYCIDTNGKNHHTDKFHLMTREVDKHLVVRRGQAFKLDILLNRPYDTSKDAVSFIFKVNDVETQEASDESSAVVPLLEKRSESYRAWSATYEGQTDSHLMVAVTPAADCIVAVWKLHVDTKLIGGSSFTYENTSPIYVLFNPWCSNDSVHMPDHSHLEEYVLNDSGVNMTGSYDNVRYASWNYDHYVENILQYALRLVREIGKVKGRARSDPILTSRALSAALNKEDDNGVIFGEWDDYRGGTAPTAWNRSLPILQSFFNHKEPVKFGQCYVFASVLTTICRALGIPCRSVATFQAGYDSQGSFIMDVMYKEDKDKFEHSKDSEKFKDKEWNFHVWNEVWMDRPDLGAEYGGWQALDSTPQRKSEGKNRCGPASLKAIKDGDVQIPYDTAVFFAAVNSDERYWGLPAGTEPKIDNLILEANYTDNIGKKILTLTRVTQHKCYPYDITDTYKYSEGSPEERMTVKKAQHSSKSIFGRYYLYDDFNDVVFDFELDDLKIGQNFNVVLQIKNRSISESHHVTGVLRVDTVTYKGVTGEGVKKQKFDINLKPKGMEVIKLLIAFDDYDKKLIDQGFFNIACLATAGDKKIDFNSDIKINIAGNPVSGEECTVSMEVENPLPIKMTNGKFYSEQLKPDDQQKFRLDNIVQLEKNVAPGEFATHQYKLTSPWAGNHQIMFTSKEMRDVNGFLAFIVVMPSETNEVSPPGSAVEKHQI